MLALKRIFQNKQFILLIGITHPIHVIIVHISVFLRVSHTGHALVKMSNMKIAAKVAMVTDDNTKDFSD